MDYSIIFAKFLFLLIFYISVKQAFRHLGISVPTSIFTKITMDKNGEYTRVSRLPAFFMRVISKFIKSVFFLSRTLLFKPIISILSFLGFAIISNERQQGFINPFTKLTILNPFNKGLLVNGRRARLSIHNSFTHSIVLATTGGGKSSKFIIPNIFKLDNCSILCTDLSGELYKKTSGYMAKKGYKVQVINPSNLKQSSCYNPLSTVKTDKEILSIASILRNSGDPNPKDPFWNQGAKNILEIIITALIGQREYRKKNNN